MEAQFKEEEVAEEGTVDVQQQWVGWYVCTCVYVVICLYLLFCRIISLSHFMLSIVKSARSGVNCQPMLHPRTCLTYGIAV